MVWNFCPYRAYMGTIVTALSKRSLFPVPETTSKIEAPRDDRNSKGPYRWQVQEWMVSTLEQIQVQNWTGPGVRSKRKTTLYFPYFTDKLQSATQQKEKVYVYDNLYHDCSSDTTHYMFNERYLSLISSNWNQNIPWHLSRSNWCIFATGIQCATPSFLSVI